MARNGDGENNEIHTTEGITPVSKEDAYNGGSGTATERTTSGSNADASQQADDADQDMTMAEVGIAETADTDAIDVIIKPEIKPEVRLEDLFADMDSDGEFPSAKVKPEPKLEDLFAEVDSDEEFPSSKQDEKPSSPSPVYVYLLPG